MSSMYMHGLKHSGKFNKKMYLNTILFRKKQFNRPYKSRKYKL